LKSPRQIEEEQIDNYERNIQVLVALSDIFRKYGGNSIIGKKLTFSEDGYITPDLVTEMNYNSAGYGILSESKVSLPQNQEYWQHDLEQLKKYDRDELQGWSFNVQNHDIVFVTDGTITLKFWEYIQKQDYRFIHKIAILESHREDKVRTFIDVKLVHGDRLSHSDLSKALEYSQRIPLQNMLGEVNAIRFYDDRPPTTYTMGIIWDYISAARIPIEEYRERKTFATIPVQINIDELLDEMRTRFTPPNNPTVLKKDWIKEALDEFVNLAAGRYGGQTNPTSFKGGMDLSSILKPKKLYVC
jgi:hypothetical protein